MGTPEVDKQLPTPRETPQPECPEHIIVPSDSLFDHPEASPESEGSGPNRTYTAPSGNPMLIVVDRNGIFDHEVVFCVCSDNDNQDELLLQSGLFPATFKITKTLFTFSVLDDFLQDNLECKTTAQQYYSKLQSTTSKMFPHFVPACSTLFHLYQRLIHEHRIYINSF
jgi:CxC2 like cysteine cluster associated with KDZ transposases